MPRDFYFTHSSGNVVGGRFRKPQIIEPEKIAASVEESFAQNVNPVFDTQYLEAMFRQNAEKVVEGVETGNIEIATLDDQHISGLVGMSRLSPGTGRVIRFNNPQKHENRHYFGLNLPQKEFTDFMDVNFYDFSLKSRMRQPPSLIVVQTLAKNRTVSSNGRPHPHHGFEDFLRQYGAYNEIGSHSVPEEFADKVNAKKTSMTYCHNCGNQSENGFRISYSRPLSPGEAAHFELMATLAAD